MSEDPLPLTPEALLAKAKQPSADALRLHPGYPLKPGQRPS